MRSGARVQRVLTTLLVFIAAACTERAPLVDPAQHRQDVEQWRAARLARLTADDGWLTLVGLYWLEAGPNRFGRAPDNALVLDHPALPAFAGTFTLADGEVSFTAAPGAVITHAGTPVTTLTLAPDTAGEPTVLESGTLSFYIIERAGKYGVRVKDRDSAARRDFRGLDYFPIDPSWVLEARVEPYDPPKKIPILNVVGLVEEMVSPGALVFEKDGQEYRLDAILETGVTDWFVIFKDATNGHETYGAGRYLYVAPPVEGRTRIDFNRAYNPPCAFTDFATCPLPPPQNWLTGLRVTAGEKKYAGGH